MFSFCFFDIRVWKCCIKKHRDFLHTQIIVVVFSTLYVPEHTGSQPVFSIWYVIQNYMFLQSGEANLRIWCIPTPENTNVILQSIESEMFSMQCFQKRILSFEFFSSYFLRLIFLNSLFDSFFFRVLFFVFYVWKWSAIIFQYIFLVWKLCTFKICV